MYMRYRREFIHGLLMRPITFCIYKVCSSSKLSSNHNLSWNFFLYVTLRPSLIFSWNTIRQSLASKKYIVLYIRAYQIVFAFVHSFIFFFNSTTYFLRTTFYAYTTMHHLNSVRLWSRRYQYLCNQAVKLARYRKNYVSLSLIFACLLLVRYYTGNCLNIQ